MALRVSRDNLALVAAGVAFYAMTSIFPAMAAFVSIYGIFADPNNVREQVQAFSSILPADSLKLLTDSLQGFADKSKSSLSIALFVSVAVALWSAKAGVSSLMTGLNIANETNDRRSWIRVQLVALAFTIGAIVFAVVALALIAVLPLLMHYVPLPTVAKQPMWAGRWILLGALIWFGAAILYRFGPCRERARWCWITVGSGLATLMWLLGSAAFSIYVSHFGSYDKTYGSLASPVVLLLWLWLSALVVLVGAEIDAEMEHAEGRASEPLSASAP